MHWCINVDSKKERKLYTNVSSKQEMHWFTNVDSK